MCNVNDQFIKDYFEFDDGDLTANRNGQLTEKQQKYLSEDLKYGRALGIGCSVLLLIIACAFPPIYYASALMNAWQTHTTAGLSGFWSTASLWTPIGVGMAVLWFFNMYSKSKPKNILKKATGPVNIVAVERRDGSRHASYLVNVLHIGSLAIDIKEALVGHMLQGDMYTVYYVENNDGSEKQVLSLEALPKTGETPV
jgi:hypothetical protein